MKGIGDRVVEVIRKSGNVATAFAGKTVESFIEALTTGGTLVPVVSDDLDAERSGIEALTAEQFRTWQALLTYNRVVVVGPAGSGKTVLAVAKARHFWQQSGGRVLLTCYNKRLAEWIRLREEFDTPWPSDANLGLAAGVHVYHFHDLASKYIVKLAGRGEEWNRLSRQKGEEAFFREIVPVLLDEATDKLGEEWRFDAVVIDEGQDFENLWLSKVQLLLKNRDNGPVMLCLGDGQRLFTTAQQYVSNVDSVHTLKHNCRNSRLIGAYAANAGKVPSLPFPASPEGEPPSIMPYLFALEDRAKAAARIVDDWLKEGVSRSSIAVLSSMGETNNYGSIPGIKQALNHPTTSDVSQWKAGGAVWISTIRAFKGMEADCIVLVDIPQSGGPNFSRNDLYVAVSRPRSRLVIVPSTNEAANEMRKYLFGP